MAGELKDLSIGFSVEITDIEVKLIVNENNFASSVFLEVDDLSGGDTTSAVNIDSAPNGKYSIPIFNWTGSSLVGDINWNMKFTFASSSDETLTYAVNIYVPTTGSTSFVAKVNGQSSKVL